MLESLLRRIGAHDLLLSVLTFLCVTPLCAQTTPRSAPAPIPAAAVSPALPDLQGMWRFVMAVSPARSSTGTMALGPIDGAWGGSLTPDSTNTLAIRRLSVHSDSVHMVVATREGDVTFAGRLEASGHVMEGIVHYHKGALYPMTVTRVRRPARQ